MNSRNHIKIQKSAIFVKTTLRINMLQIKFIVKLGTIAIKQNNVEVLDIVPIVFHNASNYDYYFIKKVLAEEFEKQFSCLGENTEKYITFSVQ